MGRYDKQRIKKTHNGTRVFNTTIYPKIERKFGDTYVIAAEYDRLDTIAQQFYGDPSLWWVIAEANGLGKGTLRITAGLQLWIPKNPKSITGKGSPRR